MRIDGYKICGYDEYSHVSWSICKKVDYHDRDKTCIVSLSKKYSAIDYRIMHLSVENQNIQFNDCRIWHINLQKLEISLSYSATSDDPSVRELCDIARQRILPILRCEIGIDSDQISLLIGDEEKSLIDVMHFMRSDISHFREVMGDDIICDYLHGVEIVYV